MKILRYSSIISLLLFIGITAIIGISNKNNERIPYITDAYTVWVIAIIHYIINIFYLYKSKVKLYLLIIAAILGLSLVFYPMNISPVGMFMTLAYIIVAVIAFVITRNK
jgi:hypothetical protein